MSKLIISAVFLVLCETLISGCLITNCPRGGKRSMLGGLETAVKPCISCGPGQRGQCFGPNICCGPFGCLFGTSDTIRCQKDGFFHEREPCIAGASSCRKHTGRCAFEGICCDQESCHIDKNCSIDGKSRPIPENTLDLYNFINYQAELNSDK